MVSAVIAKIISMQSSLTVSENEIAQYVINNPDHRAEYPYIRGEHQPLLQEDRIQGLQQLQGGAGPGQLL